MKTTNKITQAEVIECTDTTNTTKHNRHTFHVNGTTYEKTTDGMVLFHSHETYQAVILDGKNATKREFAKIVVEHFNSNNYPSTTGEQHPAKHF